MSKMNARILEFIGCIPFEIQAGWDETYAPLLARFPVNLLFTKICQPKNENEPPQMIASCCYQFDPSTFREDPEKRRMNYHSRANPKFRVEVAIDKCSTEIVVSKFHGENLLWEASGASFDLAIAHATMMGMEVDELADAEIAPRWNESRA